MSSNPASSQRDAELAQMRAELAALRADVAAMCAVSAPRAPVEVPSTEVRASSAADSPPARSAAVGRRGLLAGVAVLVAGVAAKSDERLARATDGQPLTLGSDANTSTNSTTLTRGAGGIGFEVGLRVVYHGGSTVSAVSGSSNDGTGVLGFSSTNIGVKGQVGNLPGLPAVPAGVYGLSDVANGVVGDSRDRVGMLGRSVTNHGVFGTTSAAAGTIVNGMLAAGLAGRTSSTIALYGYADGPANPSYAPVGGVGQCESGFGLWGLTSAAPGTTTRPGGGAVTATSGVLGTSANNVGVYAISSGSYALAADGNGPSTVAVLGRALGGGKAAVFVGNVEIQGHLSVSGGVNGPVSAHASGTALPSGEFIEDVGRSRLERGAATVALAPAVAAAMQGDDYDVFLTEYDDHHALYVTRRTAQGFEVRAKDSPTANSTFSYRVVARPRTTRAAVDQAATAPHVPSIPVPQGVPTLPVGRETRPPSPAPRPDAR